MVMNARSMDMKLNELVKLPPPPPPHLLPSPGLPLCRLSSPVGRVHACANIIHVLKVHKCKRALTHTDSHSQ